ncbi:MAG TPA: adenylate/guanylate cyclase domain-containing protein [Spirochaetia bacterium]|nr:adenylate/guanylate cyclase domain-containing protein [Spirochaetia bacterium]
MSTVIASGESDRGATLTPAAVPSAPAAASQASAATSPAKGPATETELGEEARLTVHRVLEAFDASKTGLESLHKDLFHPSPRVVTSALSALSKLRDQRSMRFVARLLTSANEQIRCAAVRTTAEIRHPQAARILFDLLKITTGDATRRAALEALAVVAPETPQLRASLQEYSRSSTVSGSTRALATGLLLRTGGLKEPGDLLDSAEEEVIESLFTQAQTSPEIADHVVRDGISHYHRLSAKHRALLLSLAAPFTVPGSADLLLWAVSDADQDVRRAAYQLLAQPSTKPSNLETILKTIADSVDPTPALEDEAIGALQRMEPREEQSAMGEKLLGRIQELFQTVSREDRRVVSDSHELGWLISRSKEYVEYYLDEDVRHALVQYLKGVGGYSKARLLQSLRETAVRVEVRHFDGYRALADLIEEPKRHGIALVVRELAIARLGRRKPLSLLIRNLWISRLLRTTGSPEAQEQLFLEIYTWSSQAKIFRLSEAALFALSRVNLARTAQLCRECMRTPVVSKLLAIASVHLLKDLDWSSMESSVLGLLTGADDTNVLLNLFEALASSDRSLNGEILKTLLGVVRLGPNRQVVQEAAELLAGQPGSEALDAVKEAFDRAEPWRQAILLSIVERRVREGNVSNREGLIEFLYKVLRQQFSSLDGRAAILLWRLGDDYAQQLLRDLSRRGGLEQRTELVRGLKGFVTEEMAELLAPLARVESSSLQEVLRDTLLGAEDAGAQRRICELVLTTQDPSEEDDEADAGDVQVDLAKEKRAYQFEKTFIQELAVLFTDIVGYSKKAQSLTSMQLTSMIQDYEGVLLPTVSTHQGELIKRMGDGHLFVFRSPLNAVLAAIRVQKALKRFNSYREESTRLAIRAGIHWGKVVRKEGDVLGNNVNIASRLESNARPGSVLISDAVQAMLGGHIHCREIGFIRVKNIAEPIKVHEPYELVLDFPEELDPLKALKKDGGEHSAEEAAGAAEPSEQPGEGTRPPQSAAPAHGDPKPAEGNGQRATRSLDGETARYLTETFTCLNAICRAAEANQRPMSDVRKELATRWAGLREMLQRPGA